MLKIAASASGTGLDSLIPAMFADAAYLLIMDAEEDEILQVIDGSAMAPEERSIHFAQKVVEQDCEAVLCGEIEEEPFAVLAEENSVTRYLAAGLGVQESVHKMNAYSLALIPDYIGGTGCPDTDPENCAHHDHDDE